MLKLHLGCGQNILPDYINIDKYGNHPAIYHYDILQLPFAADTVTEILAEHLFEHIGLAEEERLWRECYRVLVPGGHIIVETPDLEWLCRAFLAATDDFKDFYQLGVDGHYFGNGRDVSQRWSALITGFYGNQNGSGQFHQNGYTAAKFQHIGQLVGFSTCQVETGFYRTVQVLRATLVK